ncbi:MAG: transcriptional regulator [Candidatus Marinimicrobia bacterium]|nr:transcriptional regulator [Candidatus Neomarinimicrobiota bacterium]|tara:strand:- start:5672 stop:5944 length:273 start_codon:yes stop_codon:yes gene_type:complete
MNTQLKIEKKLRTYFNVHILNIIDESHKHVNHKKDTNGGHFKLLIVSNDFENISLIKRHQLIYDALSEMIKVEIHAISIKAITIKESHIV